MKQATYPNRSLNHIEKSILQVLAADYKIKKLSFSKSGFLALVGGVGVERNLDCVISVNTKSGDMHIVPSALFKSADSIPSDEILKAGEPKAVFRIRKWRLSNFESRQC